MTSATKLIFALAIGTVMAILQNACTNKSDNPSPAVILTGNIDSILYAQSESAAEGFVAYQNKDTVRASNSTSGHSPFFKVRMNAKARSVLGADGKLPVGSVFPEGSIVVKDLYNTVGGARQLVAIMRKESANPYAKEGWLWAEMQADGGAYVSAKDKGVLCTGCHSSNDRDFVRTFDLF
jgi:hypothetical protein